MAEPIVVNTGPLVSLARIGCPDVIGRLPYEFLCPVEVWQELVLEPLGFARGGSGLECTACSPRPPDLRPEQAVRSGHGADRRPE